MKTISDRRYRRLLELERATYFAVGFYYDGDINRLSVEVGDQMFWLLKGDDAMYWWGYEHPPDLWRYYA